MMKRYFYDDSKSVEVCEETTLTTPNTFLSNGQIWEKDDLNFFFGLIDNSKDLNIVDVGAQSGLYSLYAKFLPNCRFFSFEPFLSTYELLNKNLNINFIKNVTTYNLAISNENCKKYMSVCNSHNGLHTLSENPLRFHDVTKIEVDCRTLDYFFYENEIKIDFLKIDTEGWEFFVLIGGLKTIKKYQPIIQIEWNHLNMKQCGVDEDNFLGLINDINYEFLKTGEESILIPKK